MVNGMYNEAADEFEKCLEHRLALPCRQSRGVADAHVRRAQALFYASTLEGAEKVCMIRVQVLLRMLSSQCGKLLWMEKSAANVMVVVRDVDMDGCLLQMVLFVVRDIDTDGRPLRIFSCCAGC